jgi:hypothetical protein
MNIERTMEFILQQQAKFEENFAKAEQNFARSNRRLDRIEQMLTQTNRIVGKLASTGVSLRSDIRPHEKWLAKHERAVARHDVMMEEMEGKLNVLIDIVDKTTRRNGRSRR